MNIKIKELIKENEKLQQKNKELNTEVGQLKEQMKEDIQKEAKEIAADTLRKVFTPGQIKRLMLPNNVRTKWSTEDIISAIALRSLSPRAYRYLRNTKQIPLPAFSTLQNWVASFHILPGILQEVLQIMSIKGKPLSTTEKLTVLSFDELYVSNKLDLDRKQQKVYGSHKTCEFVMARGLFKNWKQPIYYNFD